MTDILKTASIVKDRAEIKFKAAEAIVHHSVFQSSDLCVPEHEKSVGRVHDKYCGTSDVVLVNTDKLKMNVENIEVPFKGAAANSISTHWFQATKHIVPNHCLTMPHPNVLVAKKCQVFPVKFLVHGYLTDTPYSRLWSQYDREERNGCAHSLPNHMKKNQQLPEPLLVSFKEEILTKEEIATQQLMTEDEYEQCASYAMQLYEFGYQYAKDRKILLANATYAFGKDADGMVMVVGDLHSPESAHYWIEETYAQCMEKEKDPDCMDVDYVKEWCSQHQDEEANVPQDVIDEAAIRLLSLHEIITDDDLRFETLLHDRTSMERAISRALRPIH